VAVSGGTLQFNNLSTYSGSPSLTGGAVLDLGGATFPIPNTVNLTDGSIVNFTPGVTDPYAPVSNVAFTGFSFAVNNLNDGTNGVRTFTLTNSVLTVGGTVATNGFTISGASNGVMRLTGSTTGQGDPISTKGQINVQGSAILEFASNSLFDSYRALSINSPSNPTVLVSGGTVSNLNYVIFGSAAGSAGTLRVTKGSFSMINPNPSQNGLYFGQNGGAGTFSLEDGSVSAPTIKVQSGRADINISGGILNFVTTNAQGTPANVWSLSANGAVNFNMTGGSIIATNSKFNLSSGNSSNFLTNVVYAHNGGVISSVEMCAGAGTFVMNSGTNEAYAGMYVGDNSYGVATFTQNGGLVRIKGEAGSLATNDLVIGSANGNGTYVLNGGVLEVFGKIRKNSGTSSLILNGGTICYTNSTNQTAFISSLVDTRVGTGGAIFEITDSNVTNNIQAILNDVSGQVGKLVKRGAGTLAIGRGNLGYTGSTKVEGGTLSVTDINAGYAARITRDQVIMEFASAPAGPVSTFQILPSSLEDGATSISATGLATNQQISFDPSTSIATVVTAVGPTDPYELWAQGSPLTSEILLRYALGGASSPSANDGQPTSARRTGYDLVLSVVVRANDPTLTYQPQISGDLTSNSWTNTNPPYTLPISQGVPENFERREYSVPAANSRLFLRIQVSK
jgi:fibronectin-binding autotransporter adhesin